MKDDVPLYEEFQIDSTERDPDGSMRQYQRI